MPAYALLTDAPPLKENGHGCHVLSWNLIQILGADLKLVLTRRMNPALNLEKVAADIPVPAAFYPDLSRVRWPGRLLFLKSFCELVLFYCRLPKLSRAVKISGANRLFAFFGGDAWFLFYASALAKKTGLPLDVYLVDDLVESALLARQSRWARWIRRWEQRLLNQADRVFVISPGYQEYLKAKYGIKSQWLPIPFPRSEPAYRPAQKQGTIRTVAFLGAVNVLCLDAIKDLLAAIKTWNSSPREYQLELLLMTYSDPAFVHRELDLYPHWQIQHRRTDEYCRDALRQAWAVFLPYTFDPRFRLMVKTSFPSRLAEAMTAARPLLVYGPEEASLPRYFKQFDLPVCVLSQSALLDSFQQITAVDSAALIERYRETLHRLHSREAIRQRLQILRPSALG